MNIINTTNRILLGLALPGMLLIGSATGVAYGKDVKSSATIAAGGEKQRSAQIVKKPSCEGQWCKALHAKGLCSPVSVMCKSCEHVGPTQSK